MTRPVLLLPVHGARFTLPLDRVQEVLEPRHVTRLPGAPASVLGIINVRGNVVGVLDTAVLVGLPALGAAPSVAVVRSARGIVGLATSARPAAEESGGDPGASTSLDLDAILAPEVVAR